MPELRELLRNPQVDPRARRAALEDVLTGSDELLRNFLLVLADKGRAGSSRRSRASSSAWSPSTRASSTPS